MPITKTKATPATTAVQQQGNQEDASPDKRKSEQEPSLQATQLCLLDAKLCSSTKDQYNHKEDAKKGDFLDKKASCSMPRKQLLPMGWAMQNRRSQMFGFTEARSSVWIGVVVVREGLFRN
jgi:hypothetical protein